MKFRYVDAVPNRSQERESVTPPARRSVTDARRTPPKSGRRMKPEQVISVIGASKFGLNPISTAQVCRVVEQAARSLVSVATRAPASDLFMLDKYIGKSIRKRFCLNAKPIQRPRRKGAQTHLVHCTRFVIIHKSKF